MVLMDERTPPPGAYAEGVGRGRRRRVSLERLNLPHAPIIVTSFPLFDVPLPTPAGWWRRPSSSWSLLMTTDNGGSDVVVVVVLLLYRLSCWFTVSFPHFLS